MYTIVLNEVISTTALLPDAGNLFYAKVVEGVEDSGKVVIDMSGITALPSVFLNVSIGRLIDEIGVDSLRNRISFVMITKQQAARLKDYIAKYTLRTN